MLGSFVSVTCPSCFAVFEVRAPEPGELPAEWDYDCEVCCRPMVIVFSKDEDQVIGEARGIGE